MIDTKEHKTSGRGCIFLLGAGCSIQYGFPCFTELLNNILAVYRTLPFPDETAPSVIQDLLDRTGISREGLAQTITEIFPQMDGSQCPAYMRLARMAGSGYLRAIVSLNFDELLEQAFRASGTLYQVHHKLSETPGTAFPIYKIHGSTGASNTWAPVLDLATTSIIAGDDGEREAARDMFCGNQVVLIGYSGADLKLHEILIPKAGSPGPPPELFIVNPGIWSVPLTRRLQDRDSTYLTITGPDAGFENFMEGLEDLLSKAEDRRIPLPERITPGPALRSRTDQGVVTAWRELALNVRASLQLAEFDGQWIDSHATVVSGTIRELTHALHIALNPVEDLLLNCAAFVHDLGMIHGLSAGERYRYSTSELLFRHGELSAEILNQRVLESPTSLAPSSLCEESRPVFGEIILDLCRRHSILPEAQDTPGMATLYVRDRLRHESRLAMSVRVPLLVALLRAADEMCGADQIPDVVDRDSENGSQIGWSIDDPVLYLLKEKNCGTRMFEVDRSTIRLTLPVGEKAGGPLEIRQSASNAQSYFLGRVTSAIDALNTEAWRATPRANRLTIANVKEQTGGTSGGEPTIEEYMAVSLESLTRDVEAGVPGEAALLLDLLSIYALPCGDYRRTPKVSASSGAYGAVLDRILRLEEPYERTVLSRYFEIKRQVPSTTMERWCIRNVETVLSPAMQFLGRTLDARSDVLSMITAVVGRGGTLFRGEVQRGISHMRRNIVQRHDGKAFGHDQCTLCTSRLLAVVAQVTGRHQGNWGRAAESATLLRELDGLFDELVAYLTQRSLDFEDFLGTPRRRGDSTRRLRSVRYLAYAVLGSHLALKVRTGQKDNETNANRRIQLESQVRDLSRLSDRLWEYLDQLSWTTIQQFVDEESEALNVGDVALAWAAPAVRELHPEPPRWVAEATEALINRSTAGLNAAYLWPAMLYTAHDQGTEEWAARMVELFHWCAGPNSFLWISDSANPFFGSWGYNVVNTRRVSTSLLTFWKRALDSRELFEAAFARYPEPGLT